jgi:hypothetical protein
MYKYTNNFIVFVLHVSITSELHQINLFIVDLQDPLQEHLAPPNGNAAAAIPNNNANYNLTRQQDAQPDDITNPIILNQLCLAALDAYDLQIIPAIAINAVAPAWPPQQGVSFYNGTPATSSLL